MSAAQNEPDEPDLDDLLPDDLLPETLKKGSGKGTAVPLVRTAAQAKKAAQRAAQAQQAAELKAQSVRLAQIINLHIGGYSLTQIGAAIGATAEEVDRLLSADTARYIRTQPALRTYVRNWVSERYMKMIEADWPEAVDPNARGKLENQDRVMRMLDRMAKLHGADAPVQSEVKVEAAPETVDALVARLAAGQGLGYDLDIFDVPESDIHEVAESAHTATMASGNALEARAEGDPDDGF